jgi:putative redox protein
MGQASGLTGTARYHTVLTSGRHTLVADEPLSKGGQDEGPSPGDLICAGLASCTAITLRMYTERKGWDMPQIRVEVQLLKENDNSVFVRHIDFGAAALTTEQMDRLTHVANNCPVHKLLSRQNEVQTFLKP